MGFIAGTLAIIALIFLWDAQNTTLWWIILVFVILDFFCVSAVKESIKTYGKKDKVTIFWLIVATIIQIATILLSIYAFFSS